LMFRPSGTDSFYKEPVLQSSVLLPLAPPVPPGSKARPDPLAPPGLREPEPPALRVQPVLLDPLGPLVLPEWALPGRLEQPVLLDQPGLRDRPARPVQMVPQAPQGRLEQPDLPAPQVHQALLDLLVLPGLQREPDPHLPEQPLMLPPSPPRF